MRSLTSLRPNTMTSPTMKKTMRTRAVGCDWIDAFICSTRAPRLDSTAPAPAPRDAPGAGGPFARVFGGDGRAGAGGRAELDGMREWRPPDDPPMLGVCSIP